MARRGQGIRQGRRGGSLGGSRICGPQINQVPVLFWLWGGLISLPRLWLWDSDDPGGGLGLTSGEGEAAMFCTQVPQKTQFSGRRRICSASKSLSFSLCTCS